MPHDHVDALDAPADYGQGRDAGTVGGGPVQRGLRLPADGTRDQGAERDDRNPAAR